ncbi:MAG: RluA family pseudouridine synthase [Rickettsiales bacterium]|nr:RluA family pseudouridine synthase [Rickettsiales bacterium]
MLQQGIVINAEDNSCRVDKWLKNKYQIPYTLIQKLFRKQDVLVNSKKVDAKYILKTGDLVRCYGIDLFEKIQHQDVSDDEYNKLLTQIKQCILFEDNNLVVINKPYSVAVQNGSKIKLSIDTILPDLSQDVKCRLVHRLDRYTTGVLVLGKSKEASNDLVSLFKEHNMSKQYLAVLIGIPKQKEGIIRSYIKKLDFGDKEKVSSDDDGKEAITKFKVLSISKDRRYSLVQFSPVTGRMHQIRVHASEELRCPVLGDGKYKLDSSQNNLKMHLHAYKIQFSLNSKNYNITAPLPDHMNITMKKSELQL